jgi:hypothetical protein
MCSITSEGSAREEKEKATVSITPPPPLQTKIGNPHNGANAVWGG